VKTLTLSVALTAAAVALAPVARADMLPGNYELQTARDPAHSWVWAVRPCYSGGCVHASAIPRPSAFAAPYDGDAQLANGRYTLTVDVPDGLRCFGNTLPTHDTYSWDAATLAGSVDSTFAAGCGGGPAGTYTYTFALIRM
jgi:hypothetical protein